MSYPRITVCTGAEVHLETKLFRPPEPEVSLAQVPDNLALNRQAESPTEQNRLTVAAPRLS